MNDSARQTDQLRLPIWGHPSAFWRGADLVCYQGLKNLVANYDGVWL